MAMPGRKRARAPDRRSKKNRLKTAVHFDARSRRARSRVARARSPMRSPRAPRTASIGFDARSRNRPDFASQHPICANFATRRASSAGRVSRHRALHDDVANADPASETGRLRGRSVMLREAASRRQCSSSSSSSA
jgi:hypothetical protein